MTTDVKVKTKKRKIASLDRRKARAGWIFVRPFVLGFILIYLPMVVDSIKYSFYNINVLKGGGFELIPVGWTHYSNALFDDPDFAQILVTGLLDMVFDIPMILIFSLFMAVLLNQKMAGRAAFRPQVLWRPLKLRISWATTWIPLRVLTTVPDRARLQHSLTRLT